MTRQEVIFKVMAYTDYYHPSDKGLIRSFKIILKKCGFRHNEVSDEITDRAIRFVFPALRHFDNYCPDEKYKMSALRAIYFNSIAGGQTGDLLENFEEYDKIAVRLSSNDPTDFL